jgi:predicted O-linked N-acetylglucosamine transferase (SPINDLY family)
LEPTNVAGWINKAIVFNKCRLHKQATESYRHVVEQLPHDAGARVAILLHMEHMCDWSTLDEDIRILKSILNKPDYLESYQLSRAMPSTILSIPHITPQEQLLFAKKYTQISMPATPPRSFRKRLPAEKINIAYFSGDFNQHPVSQLMVEVLELHDREHFNVKAYSDRPSDGSKLRERVEQAVDEFIDITLSSDDIVIQRILSDKIDILVDLSSYTEASRSELLALRPAPIQVNYLGYLGTMGADFIDYLIADDFLVPPGNDVYYSEKIVRLPSYQANDRKYLIKENPGRAACHLPEDAFVFCCFNINYKITPDFFDVWCKLLNNIPGSVLWLFASTEEPMSNLCKEAQKRGVNPERLIFAPWVAIDDHMARLSCADLFLDTAPYNAGTTASNALWAGLPVITCSGQTFSSRMAGSLLTALNVPELITYNLDDYYQLAYELATQPNKRKAIQKKVIANKDTALLFDSEHFTRSLENAYRDMIRDYEKQRAD